MNSRLNLGGFSVPQNREFQSNNPWIPVSPQQPVPVRPNATPLDINGGLPGSSSWWELADLQNGYLEEMPSAGRSVQNLVQGEKSVQMPPSNGRPIHSLVQCVQMPTYGIPVQNLILNVKSQQAGANIQNTCMLQRPSNVRPPESLIPNRKLVQNDANIEDGHWQELPSYGRSIENLIKKRTTVQNESNFQDRYLQGMFSYGMPVKNAIESKSSVQNEANIQDSYLQQLLSYDKSVQKNIPCTELVPSGENFRYSADINNNQMNGPIPTSFTEFLNMEETDWSNGPISDNLALENAVLMPSAKEIPSSPVTKDNIFLNLDYSPAPSSYREFSSRSALSDQNGVSGTNTSCSKILLNQMTIHEMREPSRPVYDLNLIPGIEANDPQIANYSIQFAPPTPEQAKLRNNQLFGALDSIVDDDWDKQKLVLFTGEASSNQSDELLQSVVDSSKKKDTATDREQGIDLNKTPQLKPPKRRKHRPKVVIEGKPKRSKTSKSSEKPRSKEKHSGKRKYVRKKGLKESGSQQPIVMKETKDDEVRTAGKSCRRALNFDMEKTTVASRGGGKEIEQKETVDYGVNVSPHSAESSNLCEIWPDPLIGKEGKSITEHQQLNTHNLTSSMDHRHAAGHFSLERWTTSKCPPASNKDKEIDAGVTTKLVNIASDTNWPDSLNNIQKIAQRYDYIGGQMARERGGDLENLTRSTQVVTKSITKPNPAAPSTSKTTRKTKRDRYAIEQADLNMNPSNSSYLLQRMFQGDECQNVNGGVLEANKKKKIEKRPSADNHATQRFVPPFESSSKHNCRKHHDKEVRDGETYRISQPYAGSVNSSGNTSHSSYLSNQYLQLVPSPHYTKTSAAHNQYADRKEEPSSLTQATHEASQETQNHPLMIVGVPKPNKLMEHHILLRTEASGSTKHKSGQTKKSLQHKNKDIIHEKQYSVGKEKGSESTIGLMDPISIDGITEKLRVLNLGENSHDLMKPTENAIVLYNGDGRIVPYEIKKRKPRPKVNLDPETNRMWNLLMGKEASEGYEGIDMEKENRWRNEREVFCGRANSFIARMHLVQGDRRFSPWKGSVVDSVIGVFLTQNVSDHLSSSAFMLLAARFPVRSRNSRTSYSYAEGILVEQQEGIMMNPTDIIRYHPNKQPICNSSSIECWRDGAASGIQRTDLFVSQGHSREEEVISSQESFECSAIEENGALRSYSGSNSESEDFSINDKSKTATLFNLKSSAPKEKSINNDSYSHLNRSTLAYQTPKDRFQQSEGKAYDNQNPRLNLTHNTNTSSAISHLSGSGNIVLFPPASSAQHNLQLTLDSTISKAGSYDALTEESISSWPTASRSIKFKEVNRTANQSRKQPGSNDKSIMHPQGLLHYGETFRSQYIISSRNIMQQRNDCHMSIDATVSQPTFNNDQSQMKLFFHPDANHSDAAVRQFDIAQCSLTNPNHIQTVTGESTPELSQNYSANNIVHPTSEVPHRSSAKINNREATIMHATATVEKGKPKIDSKNKINWDNLRKEVLRVHGKKERSRNAKDSIGYEAMRKSSITEISAVIKARGMSNMLAERIKEFLDRLVMDHGSIDLEWLRDVPPDQAKDYLLSIRGLGLKSVECVRLLTLHHVAFPVDTNVGRIAVRLGWVPLQPLPEELQLHLLELYPVLESIQKYLWPRLCKLDQQTLYELHYQLITFGKVFCTKTKPNCNACPMRGECRHFASAFASARLALPGPEESRMVASEVPIVHSNPPIAINAALMTPLEDHSFSRPVTMGSSAPIVEHPPSPERNSTVVPDSDIEDIEDALCEEEEEEQIPIIRLDMQAFSENLQSYMQGNMELQERDMSMALVTLSAQAASIPAQKLKNITRLRTEHHVYELPDDHPLLEGMDKRERDDPSPYLLAIWAPGETANSTEPAQMQCQGSGPLCKETTCCRYNSMQESNSQTIRGTLLIPCRTAMRGSFPLNGTYFQVNEMFADHASSINPICAPRESIWNLRRRTVFFGSSVSSIFKGLSTEQIQSCFWRGFICVRGFDQEARAPRPLAKHLHISTSKMVKTDKGRRA